MTVGNGCKKCGKPYTKAFENFCFSWMCSICPVTLMSKETEVLKVCFIGGAVIFLKDEVGL